MQVGRTEQYRVADFLDWDRRKLLVSNPDFQRRAVWNQDIKSYLINSLLRGFPMPMVYMRSSIDIVSQKAVREIVDGQQRVRTIIEFAAGKLRLNKRAEEFSGLVYGDLDEESKQAFLSYAISVEQLINASNETVLEIFRRLNTYSVPLNPAELRHAEFNGEFKFAVRKLATELSDFWERYKVFSLQSRLRMMDDELTAELYAVLIDGVRGGGKPYLQGLYRSFDASFPNADDLTARVSTVIKYLDDHFSEALEGELFSRPPHLLILFAAVAHKLYGLPEGDMKGTLPDPEPNRPISLDAANASLARLTIASQTDPPPAEYSDFILASRGATVRKASRLARFRFVWEALTTSSK